MVEPEQAVGHDSGVTLASATTTYCPGCRVGLPALDAPAHPYMTCSPACWVRYGDLLAAQYSNPDRLAFHQIVVDTYAVQHPDGDDPRAIQSVGIHLMTLCLFLERGTDPFLGTRLHRFMVGRPVFNHLMPPSSRGRLTILDMPVNGDPATARRAAYAWAEDVWTAGAAHHQTVRDWVDRSGLGAYK